VDLEARQIAEVGRYDVGLGLAAYGELDLVERIDRAVGDLEEDRVAPRALAAGENFTPAVAGAARLATVAVAVAASDRVTRTMYAWPPPLL